jgi:UDP-GlcNAc3NAcA epimerase
VTQRNIISIVGARPQFVKAAVISKLIQKDKDQRYKETIVHTGQHYDKNMSDNFFEELDIPSPDYHLGIGSGEHGLQTGKMLIAIEKVLMEQKPDIVLVYGDTNSTLAGALAASKLHIPVAHIEAGLRSFGKKMPEEINRVLTDHVSSFLFCPTEISVANLKKEGIKEGVYLTGDVMWDSLFDFQEKIGKSNILKKNGLQEKKYYLITVHRAGNVDNLENFENILSELNEIEQKVVFPLHPRTKKMLTENQYSFSNSAIHFVDPVGYIDMLALEKNALAVLTDSGGVQKEAYFFKVPCITLREETEWLETVESGWNVLAGTDKKKIKEALGFQAGKNNSHQDFYGDGKAGEKILQILKEYVN